MSLKILEQRDYSNKKLDDYCRELKEKIPLNNQVLFIKGPQFNQKSFEIDVAKNRCYYTYPPTGLQYLAAAIEDRNLETRILDLNFEFLKRIVGNHPLKNKKWISILEESLQDFNPSVVGVSNLFAVDIPSFREILKYLKNKNKVVIAGGQNATYESERLLRKGLCNFVCQRESENKINFLFDHLYENKGHKPTPGILFEYNKEIVETEGQKDVVELKGNLIRSYNLIPVEEYCSAGTLSPYSRISGKDKPFATVVFNRGCEGGCKFCGVCDYVGKRVRSRKIKDFLDEVEYLNKERGIGHIELLDDDFARYKDKALKVLQGMIDRGISITWASNNGIIARTLDKELMEKMRDSGCLGFKVGVESGNPEILKKIRKPGNLKIFRNFSKIAQKFPEMFIADNYILGFPDENFGKIMDSYNFSLEMNLDWSCFSVYQHNVSYFGDKEERAKMKDNVIGDFIPAKDETGGKLQSSEGIKSGIDVFNIPYDSIPSREQLGQIWFAFDFIRNFIQNKNLSSNGRKFIRWVRAIEERYPTQPHINFSLSISNYLIGDNKEAENQYLKMKKNLEDDYWREKFEQFQLMEIVNIFPKNLKKAEETLEFLREKYKV